MDEIRKHACHLATATMPAPFSGAAEALTEVSNIIAAARLWEAYLREDVPSVTVEALAVPEEEPIALTEAQIIAAMMGGNPDAIEVLMRAQVEAAGIIEKASAIFGTDYGVDSGGGDGE